MGVNIELHKPNPNGNSYIEFHEKEQEVEILKKFTSVFHLDKIIDEKECEKFGKVVDYFFDEDVWEFEKDGRIIEINDSELPYTSVKVYNLKTTKLEIIRLNYTAEEIGIANLNQISNFKEGKNPLDIEPPSLYKIKDIETIIDMIANEKVIEILREWQKKYENENVLIYYSW